MRGGAVELDLELPCPQRVEPVEPGLFGFTHFNKFKIREKLKNSCLIWIDFSLKNVNFISFSSFRKAFLFIYYILV